MMAQRKMSSTNGASSGESSIATYPGNIYKISCNKGLEWKEVVKGQAFVELAPLNEMDITKLTADDFQKVYHVNNKRIT